MIFTSATLMNFDFSEAMVHSMVFDFELNWSSQFPQIKV